MIGKLPATTLILFAFGIAISRVALADPRDQLVFSIAASVLSSLVVETIVLGALLRPDRKHIVRFTVTWLVIAFLTSIILLPTIMLLVNKLKTGFLMGIVVGAIVVVVLKTGALYRISRKLFKDQHFALKKLFLYTVIANIISISVFFVVEHFTAPPPKAPPNLKPVERAI